MTSDAPDWYGAAARNTAYQPIMQVSFMLIYAVWWALAWQGAGTVAFGLAVAYAAVIIGVSIVNVRHSRAYPNISTPAGAQIGKHMGILSGVSYGVLWILVIVLAVLGHWRWILPVAALVIGIHFLPLAFIFNRKIDFLLAPVASAFAVYGLVLAAQADVSWQVVYAVSGTGGAIATAVYAMYLIRTYRRLAVEAGVSGP